MAAAKSAKAKPTSAKPVRKRAVSSREVSVQAEPTSVELPTQIAAASDASTLNTKMLRAFQVQGETALNLWTSTLAAGSLSEAISIQTRGMREAYEVTSAHWKDVADSAGRWWADSLKASNRA